MALGKVLNLLMFADAIHGFLALWGLVSGEQLKVDFMVIAG